MNNAERAEILYMIQLMYEEANNIREEVDSLNYNIETLMARVKIYLKMYNTCYNEKLNVKDFENV